MRSQFWVPRCAVVAIAVLLMTCGVMAQHERQPSPHEVADAPSSHCLCVGEEATSSIERIKQALSNPLNEAGLEFVDTPLKNVVVFLQDEYNLPIQIDAPALADIGLGPDEPVNVNLRNITLRSALRLMLNRLELVCVIQDEVLLITTPEKAESEFLTCVYDIRDLIRNGNHDRDIKSLVAAITSCVATKTWACNGGVAEIHPLRPGLLVVSQTQTVHEMIGELLTAVRKLRDAAPETIVADAVRDSAEESPAGQSDPFRGF